MVTCLSVVKQGTGLEKVMPPVIIASLKGMPEWRNW